MGDEGEEPPPVLRWKKVVAGIVITFLVLYPMYFLLQFGLAQGKRIVRSWLIGTLTCWALSFAIAKQGQASLEEDRHGFATAVRAEQVARLGERQDGRVQKVVQRLLDGELAAVASPVPRGPRSSSKPARASGGCRCGEQDSSGTGMGAAAYSASPCLPSTPAAAGRRGLGVNSRPNHSQLCP